MEQIIMNSEEGDSLSFFVIEETKLNGTQYLLVSEQNPDETEESDVEEVGSTILKCVSEEGEEAVFEFVEDDAEWDAVLSVFSELLEDIDIVE